VQTKRAELENGLATAVTTQVQTHREVDTYKIEKVGVGQAARSAAKGKSDQLKGQLDAEYASRRAEIDAFRTPPVERVMQRLGERLKGVTIEIQPFRNDGSPSRIPAREPGRWQVIGMALYVADLEDHRDRRARAVDRADGVHRRGRAQRDRRADQRGQRRARRRPRAGLALADPGVHKLLRLPSSYFMLDFTNDDRGRISRW